MLCIKVDEDITVFVYVVYKMFTRSCFQTSPSLLSRLISTTISPPSHPSPPPAIKTYRLYLDKDGRKPIQTDDFEGEGDEGGVLVAGTLGGLSAKQRHLLQTSDWVDEPENLVVDSGKLKFKERRTYGMDY